MKRRSLVILAALVLCAALFSAAASADEPEPGRVWTGGAPMQEPDVTVSEYGDLSVVLSDVTVDALTDVSLAAPGKTGTAAIVSDAEYLTIEVTGECVLNSGDYGIFSTGTVMLTGDGTLTVNGTTAGIYARGVSIAGGKVRVKAGGGLYGIWTEYPGANEYDTDSGTYVSAYLTAEGSICAINGNSFSVNAPDCHSIGYTSDGAADELLGYRRHGTVYREDLAKYTRVYAQSTGLAGIDITCGGPGFGNGTEGAGSSPVMGEYINKPDPRLNMYWGTGAPLFYEDGTVISSEDRHMRYYFSTSDGAGETLHEIILAGSEELDPALLSVEGARITVPFSMGSYGDNGSEQAYYGTKYGSVMYYYTAEIAIPTDTQRMSLYYDGFEIRSFDVFRRDFSKLNSPVVCTFWPTWMEEGEDGGLDSFGMAISGFNLSLSPENYVICSYDQTVTEGENGKVMARAVKVTPLDTGKLLLEFEVTGEEFRDYTVWNSFSNDLFLPIDTENDVSLYAGGTHYRVYGYFEEAGALDRDEDGVYRVARGLTSYKWAQVSSPFDSIYREFDTVCAAVVYETSRDPDTGEYTDVPYFSLSVSAAEEDVGRPVVAAFFDGSGRMTGYKLIIIKEAGVINVKYPVNGEASAKVFCLSGGILPVINVLVRDLT